MRRSRTPRQLIVGIAITLMVFCQGAALAAACAPAPSVGSNVVAPPCHDEYAPGQSDAGKDGCPSQCQASLTSPEPSKFDSGLAITLPLRSAYTVTAASVQCAARYEPPLQHATAPPLPIVLCRLLN
jgi:hypothetical protein